MPTAFITGIAGQDGSYLAELLLSKGYRVIGMACASDMLALERVEAILPQLTLVEGDLANQACLTRLIGDTQPNEIYNFAAQSFVPASWQDPVHTSDITALGVARLLEAARTAAPQARFYQASTSEMFGDPLETPQNEATPLRPRTPYGISKAYGHWMTINYREHYGMFALSGILFNHESPRRPLDFVTRKICHGAARIALGLDHELRLGNLDAHRDWGFAGDYVEAIWRMLQQEKPEDLVIGSGQTHAVRDWCQIAFSHFGLDYQKYVVVDPRFYRPPEPHQLVSEPRQAHTVLDWQPQVSFEQLVIMMANAEMALLEQAPSPL